MKFKNNSLQKMHEAEGKQKISLLEQKMAATQFNIEISKEIIDGTPSNAERRRLIAKNAGRKRAVGAIRKEIRDLEQTMEERSKEVNT